MSPQRKNPHLNIAQRIKQTDCINIGRNMQLHHTKISIELIVLPKHIDVVSVAILIREGHMLEASDGLYDRLVGRYADRTALCGTSVRNDQIESGSCKSYLVRWDGLKSAGGKGRNIPTYHRLQGKLPRQYPYRKSSSRRRRKCRRLMDWLADRRMERRRLRTDPHCSSANLKLP